MNRISILDCTLRDGGYINDFLFGEKIIKNIVDKLSKASIDIIECGFFKSGAFDSNKSLYGSINAVSKIITEKNKNLMYVAMLQYGAISDDEIDTRTDTSIDGIRITFHEHEIEPAFVLGEKLMHKGYKIFMQPVGTITYTDESLIKLIQKVNDLHPFAFYLVDTLGTMYKNDLLRMFYLVDHNLDKKIAVGFHSHNNLQLSFANAQELMQLNTPRQLIIDSSVFGMGRGAGNLNTELVTQYINTNFGLQYNNLEILEILDTYIKPLSIQYKWGYDAAYYIASITSCHPNYASFLLNKQTMHIQDIYAILKSLESERKALYDKDYIGEQYLKYMNHHIDDTESREILRNKIGNKKVLLLAPGKSLKKYESKILEYIKNNDCYVACVNFIPQNLPYSMIFISNMKRFFNLKAFANQKKEIDVVVTSNITTQSSNDIKVVDYTSYTNEEQVIADNAGLMCINLLNKVGVQKIVLAGFDGFSVNKIENYYDNSFVLDVEQERLLQITDAMKKKLSQLQTQLEIRYLTPSAYENK